MNILAIDVTGKKAYVTSKINNNITNSEDLSNITHSEKLLPLIHNNLSGFKIKDLDLIITTNGPGSFTGCRIGVATVKAIAHVNNTKILSIPSLELLAFTEYYNNYINKEVYILSLLDARNNRAYYSLYKFKTINKKIQIEKIIDINNENIENILKNIKKYSNIIFTGETENFKNILKDYTIKENNLNSKYLINYYENINDLKFTNYKDLDVIYARMSQAERTKNENNKS